MDYNAIRYSKTRFSDIMSFDTYKHFDKVIRSGQKFAEGAKLPATKYLIGRGTNLLTSAVIKYIKEEAMPSGLTQLE